MSSAKEILAKKKKEADAKKKNQKPKQVANKIVSIQQAFPKIYEGIPTVDQNLILL